MGGFRWEEGSKNHSIRKVGPDTYRISWTVAHYYEGDRAVYTRLHARTTDEAGARRFAKKWSIAMPAPTPPTTGDAG